MNSDNHIEINETHKYIYAHIDRTVVQYKRVKGYVDRALFIGYLPE